LFKRAGLVDGPFYLISWQACPAICDLDIQSASACDINFSFFRIGNVSSTLPCHLPTSPSKARRPRHCYELRARSTVHSLVVCGRPESPPATSLATPLGKPSSQPFDGRFALIPAPYSQVIGIVARPVLLGAACRLPGVSFLLSSSF
jgi:hypothetical protein